MLIIIIIIIIIIMKAKIIVTLYIKNVTGALYTVNYNESVILVVITSCFALKRLARSVDCL